MAPVSVARSTMARGLYLSCTYQSASASTSRPSASVLTISIVVPEAARTMSPGRMALPLGMFSTSPITPTALILALRRLDRNATGVEHDPLADEGDRRSIGHTAVPAHDDQPRRPDRSLRHREHRVHVERPQLRLAQRLDGHTQSCQLSRAGAQHE